MWNQIKPVIFPSVLNANRTRAIAPQPPTPHTHTPGRYINPSQFNPKSNYMDRDYVDKVIVCGRVRHTKQHQLTTSAFELVAFILVTYDR